jgi:hypothetical protein
MANGREDDREQEKRRNGEIKSRTSIGILLPAIFFISPGTLSIIFLPSFSFSSSSSDNSTKQQASPYV